MKDRALSVSAFKTHCLRLLDELASEGGSILITKHGRPVAQVTPPPPVSPPRLKGTWAGEVRVTGDVVHFDTSKDWEANR